MENLNKENKQLSIFENTTDFEIGQRMASALSKSTVVPKEYQNNVSNTLIAVDMSTRMGLSPMMVMQNLYIINGRPSWSSQFIIAVINNSKKFAKPLNFKVDGKGENLSCYCYTWDYDGNEVVGPTITMSMAKEEGWISKNLSKWRTMPEVMIRYRAASFFGRLYCSDILMGVYSDEENMEVPIKTKEEVPNTFVIPEEVPNTFVDAEIIETPDFLKEGEEDGTK